MIRDRAARLALVLILVTGLLVSRRLDPGRQNPTSWPPLPSFPKARRQVVETIWALYNIVLFWDNIFRFFCYPLPGVAF